MRKFLILGIAVVLGGAALLIPAGAAAFNNGDVSKGFTATVTSPINVQCAAGATTGTATYSVTISKGGTSGSTGSLDGGSIVVTRNGNVVATFTDYGTQQVTETAYPCPTTSSQNGSSSFTFQPKTAGGSNTGTAATVQSTTTRTGSSS